MPMSSAADCTAMSMSECLVCSKQLPSDGAYLICCSCTYGYHLGAQCAGVAEKTYRGMSASKRQEWLCKTCRTGDTRTASNKPSDSIVTETSVLIKIMSELSSLKESVNALLVLPAKVDELAPIKVTVESLLSVKDTVEGIKEAVSFLSDQYDTLLVDIRRYESEVTQMQEKVSTLETEITSQAKEIKDLHVKINVGEQYSRRLNLEIQGIPFTPGEDLCKVLLEVAQKSNIEYCRADVQVAHRLPTRSDRTPAILVRFASINAKDKWIKARKFARDASEIGSLPKGVFFNDNLTSRNKELLWKAKVRAKERGYRFVWVKNGKILAKKAEGTPVFPIITDADIDNIV